MIKTDALPDLVWACPGDFALEQDKVIPGAAAFIAEEAAGPAISPAMNEAKDVVQRFRARKQCAEIAIDNHVKPARPLRNDFGSRRRFRLRRNDLQKRLHPAQTTAVRSAIERAIHADPESQPHDSAQRHRRNCDRGRGG